MEQLELVKALLAGQAAKHDPANSVFGAPSMAPVPGSIPQMGPTLADIGQYLKTSGQGAFVDPVANFGQSSQAQNLLGARDAIQGGLAPRPLPPGASGVMGSMAGRVPGGPIHQQLGLNMDLGSQVPTDQPTATPPSGLGLWEKIKGLAGDAWNSPFIQGADPIQGPDLPGQSYAERSQPESLHTNITQALERAGDISLSGMIPDYLKGPLVQFGLMEGPGEKETPIPSISVEWDPAAPQDTVKGLAPSKPTVTGKGYFEQDKPLITYETRTKLNEGPPAFDETPTIWDKLNASNWQEILGGMARGVAGPIPVGGGGVGHVFAGAGAGADVARQELSDADLSADRYATALGMKMTDQEIAAYEAESGRISAKARSAAARAAAVNARINASKPSKDPRKEQAEVYSSGAGASAQQRVIDQAKTSVANNYLDPEFKKILSDMAKASLVARLGENWEGLFEASGKQQEILDAELAAQVGQILSATPELLMEIYPELGPLAAELWIALAELGGASVYRNE